MIGHGSLKGQFLHDPDGGTAGLDQSGEDDSD